MGSQINTNAKKADFESVAFRAFNFDKMLTNDKVPMKTYLALLILKIHIILPLNTPQGT